VGVHGDARVRELAAGLLGAAEVDAACEHTAARHTRAHTHMAMLVKLLCRSHTHTTLRFCETIAMTTPHATQQRPAPCAKSSALPAQPFLPMPRPPPLAAKKRSLKPVSTLSSSSRSSMWGSSVGGTLPMPYDGKPSGGAGHRLAASSSGR
jgi:hypothetical protein